MIRQPKNGLQPGQSPPAVPARQTPEAFRHTGIETLQTGFRTGGQAETIAGIDRHFDTHVNRLRINDHRRERPTMTMMAFHQVQRQIP